VRTLASSYAVGSPCDPFRVSVASVGRSATFEGEKHDSIESLCKLGDH
jgi:hypothetical protein